MLVLESFVWLVDVSVRKDVFIMINDNTEQKQSNVNNGKSLLKIYFKFPFIYF